MIYDFIQLPNRWPKIDSHHRQKKKPAKKGFVTTLLETKRDMIQICQKRMIQRKICNDHKYK